MQNRKKAASNLAYNQFIYVDKDVVKVNPKFCSLIRLTAPDIAIATDLNNLALNQFVNITQKIWLRSANTKSRWDISSQHEYAEAGKLIINILQELGIFAAQSPSKKNYTGAIILGTSTANLAKRLFYLQDLINAGIQFENVYLMGSLEDITQYLDTLKKILLLYPERFKNDIVIPENMTENGLMNFFIENLIFLEGKLNSNVINLPSPMKISPDKKLIKPTTQDEFKKFSECLKVNNNNQNKEEFAVFSHSPFSFRQNLIFIDGNTEVIMETISAALNQYGYLNDLPASVVTVESALDEMARLFWQLSEFVRVEGNIEKINLSSSMKFIINDSFYKSKSQLMFSGANYKENIIDKTLHDKSIEFFSKAEVGIFASYALDLLKNNKSLSNKEYDKIITGAIILTLRHYTHLLYPVDMHDIHKACGLADKHVLAYTFSDVILKVGECVLDKQTLPFNYKLLDLLEDNDKWKIIFPENRLENYQLLELDQKSLSYKI